MYNTLSIMKRKEEISAEIGKIMKILGKEIDNKFNKCKYYIIRSK